MQREPNNKERAQSENKRKQMWEKEQITVIEGAVKKSYG